MSGGGFIDNIVDTVTDPLKDAGSWIDDKVNEEIPGGWYTVAAVTGAYYAPEMIAAGNAAESAALAEGATAAEAAAAGEAAATAAGASATEAAATDFLGSQALGNASTGAVGSGSTGVGLSAGSASGGAAGGTGISTGSLVGTPLGAGMGGVGTSASSGLGYLGGAEALPSGTAGITGVTAPMSITPKNAIDALRLGNQLFGGQQQQPYGGLYQGRQNTRPQGVVDYSPTLSLLNQRTSTPNVYSLLG